MRNYKALIFIPKLIKKTNFTYVTVIDRSRTPLALINITALVAPSTTEDISASSVIVTTNKRGGNVLKYILHNNHAY